MAKLNIQKLGKAAIVRGGGALVGGAAGAAANKIIPSSMSPVLRGVLKAAVGAVIPEISPKSEFVKAAGSGMVGQAGGELFEHFTGSSSDSSVKGTEVISGDGEYIIDEEIHGTDDDQIISGDGDEEYIEGIEGIDGTDDEDGDPVY